MKLTEAEMRMVFHYRYKIVLFWKWNYKVYCVTGQNNPDHLHNLSPDLRH